MIHVRSLCRVRAHPGDAWLPTECVVSYADAAPHRALVEQSFRDDLALDPEDIRRERPYLFEEPHNVARALAMHHCFRPYAWTARHERWELIEETALPRGRPSARGAGFSVWIQPLA